MAARGADLIPVLLRELAQQALETVQLARSHDGTRKLPSSSLTASRR